MGVKFNTKEKKIEPEEGGVISGGCKLGFGQNGGKGAKAPIKKTKSYTIPKKKGGGIPRIQKPQKIEGAYRRLQDLGPDKFDYIELLVYRGESPADIATLVHERWRDCLDISRINLRRLISRFKTDYVGHNMVLAAESIPEKEKQNILRKTNEHLDVLKELTELARIQKDRISKILTKEKMMPLAFSWTRHELSTYKKILEGVATQQFNIGVVRKYNPQLDSNLTAEIEEAYSRLEDEVKLSDEEVLATQKALAELGIDPSNPELVLVQ